MLEDGGAKSVAAWATAISPGPAGESSQSVTFSVTADDPTLFAAQPAVAPDGTLTYTPAADAYGVASVTIVAHDDGGTANGGTDASPPLTFALTIDPVDDAPSFSAGANQTLLEDGGAQSVNGWATAVSSGPANESSQSVTFTAVADNPALFAVQPAVAPSGKLTFTPAANANGAATVTVIAHDDGGTANGGIDDSPPSTFTVTVGSVNDAPSFTAGPDQLVLSLAGGQAVPGWATSILSRAWERVAADRQLHRHQRQPGALRRPAAGCPERTSDLHPQCPRDRSRNSHGPRGGQRRHRQRGQRHEPAPDVHHHDHLAR